MSVSRRTRDRNTGRRHYELEADYTIDGDLEVTGDLTKNGSPVGGGGGVAGPASSTDNAIVRFNGTGGSSIQDSSAIVDDEGRLRIGAQTGFDADYLTDFYFNSSEIAVGMLNVPQGAFAKVPIAAKIEDNNTTGNVYAMNFQAVATHASGSKNNVSGGNLEAYKKNAGTVTNLYGMSTYAQSDGGTVSKMVGHYVTGHWKSAGTVNSNYGLYCESQGGVGTNNYALWIADQGAGATDYAFWVDSPGVFRIKGDGVMAYYNPSFTKYTPAAVNHERIVQQWASNIAQIGTEAGGTGTLRKLRLIGAGLILSTDILPTSNPAVAGQLWNDSGTLKVSAG